MRSVFLSIFAVAAALVIPASQADANHFREIRAASCEYADAAHLFHRSVARSRRATDYAERLADRLAHAADDLHDAIVRDADPRRVAVLYDEVYVLHDRLSELLGSRCASPDRIVLSYWGPLDDSFERLVCAIEGCGSVCPLITNRRVVVQRPAIIVQPPSFSPGFGHGFGAGFGPAIGPSFGPSFGSNFGPGFDPRSGRGADFGQRDFGHRDLGHDHGRRSSSFGGFPSTSPAGRPEFGNRGSGRIEREPRDRFERDRSNEIRRGQGPEDIRSAFLRRMISRIID